MKYRITLFLSLLILFITPALAFKVIYEGCPRAMASNSPTPQRFPVVVKCNGQIIQKAYMLPGQSFNVDDRSGCNHYIVEYARSAENPTFGSLGVDCSGQLAGQVVRFKETWQGCLCQYQKYQ